VKKIGIIGGGFSGTMTAVHLVREAVEPLEIIMISEQQHLNKGIAFNPYSKKLLLNVAASKMSAFANDPEHFLRWVMQQENFRGKDENIIANSFLPRYLYGEYLSEIWKDVIASALKKKIKLSVIDDVVTNIDPTESVVSISLGDGRIIETNVCVIASGNQVPRNPKIKNMQFFGSENYFQNPWDVRSVSNADSRLPILLVGNGLTMVDTVMGLLENNFQNSIVSISPNGFNILPHRHMSVKYTKLTDELRDNASLKEIVSLFNKHIKLLREFGLSPEPIIDSMRPHTQKIWQRLSTDERKFFMARLRHLWGVARHRIPLHIHDKIQQLQIDGKLRIHAGNLVDINEEAGGIKVEFYNKKEKQTKQLFVSRVINCTGPETDLTRVNKSFLKNCLLKGIISQDELRLGINADPKTFQLINSSGVQNKNLFTLGSNLRGMLWETTAVNELRQQANDLAREILKV
jgi:uncharacterized NAD(P)/FAD-binding protein YdhS